MRPASFFLLRIALAILGLIFFQMNFMTAFFISMRYIIGILIGIILNLYGVFGRLTILTILILPIQEHGRSFHLLRFSFLHASLLLVLGWYELHKFSLNEFPPFPFHGVLWGVLELVLLWRSCRPWPRIHLVLGFSCLVDFWWLLIFRCLKLIV